MAAKTAVREHRSIISLLDGEPFDHDLTSPSFRDPSLRRRSKGRLQDGLVERSESLSRLSPFTCGV